MIRLNVQELQTAIAEIADIPANEGHPLLTKIKFIFATADEGFDLSTKQQGLKQGIKAEEFDEIIRTSLNTPIKMRYLGFRGGVGNHIGSIPIGHITGMEKIEIEGKLALAAEGVLYASEYPEEIDYLKTAFAAKEAPGISYEIRYDNNLSVVEEGVQWIKGLITQAATIVRSPAYGNRTAILALASNRELTDDELNTELRTLLPEEQEGGSDMDKDKEIERLTALASEKEAALVELKTAKDTEVEALKKSLEETNEKLAEASTENENLKRTILLETRAQAFTSAGLSFDQDEEKAKAKKELLAKMDEDVFTAYLDDLKSASTKKTAAALASASADRGVPKLTVTERIESLDDLKTGLRGISRG